MSNFPHFSNHSYQIKRELGHNRAGGRVTYLATDTNTEMPVVIKQFQFAQADTGWSEYDAIEREIQLLQQLNHPSIPCYLDSFETESGFCLVQEYKHAPSLAQPHLWTLEEIKQIAVAVLEVLVYLQQQIPPVIHRDIKPENILVEQQHDQLKVTLVDFGFATGCGDVTSSSAVKGTVGFMPPEQLFNRQLTEASDLYSLGATLICLLTKTKTSQIGNLIDDAYRINFRKLVPHVEPRFVDWLEKMVEPNAKNRFENAAVALEALLSLDKVDIAITSQMPDSGTKFRRAAAALGITTLGFVTFVTLGQNSQLRQENSLLSAQMQVHSATAQTKLQQVLLDTHQCPKCDLYGAELSGVNLGDANLKATNLGGANLENADLVNANLWKANLGYAYLGNANLENADLRGAQLGGAQLGGAQLGGANLGYAYLGSANLENADLRGANLWGADLRGAQLWEIKLEGANLRSAQLGGVNLRNADLGGVRLEDADLEGADLENADLEGADLEGVKLGGANLLGAYLQNADLMEANLEGADLRGANLSNANLMSAYLRGANLRGANLRDANLRGANLRGADLKGAIMPNGVIHP